MINRLLIALLWVLSLSLSSAFAQSDAGDWKLYPTFSRGQKNIIDCELGVFFVADGNLFRYDKNSASVTAYSKRTMLNDNEVSNIYYNYDYGYLLVTYTSSNIDLILADGSVVNLPDIADISITSTRTINDVTFYGANAYIAADFGYLVLDGNDRRIVEANIFFTPVKSVIQAGGMIWVNAEGKMYSAMNNAPHASLSLFKECQGVTGSGKMLPVNEANFFYADDKGLILVTIESDGALKPASVYGAAIDYIQKATTGFIAQNKQYAQLLRFDNEGTDRGGITLPQDMASSLLCPIGDGANMWELSEKGIRKVQLNGATVSSTEKFILPSASTVKRVGNLKYNKALDKLYVMTGGTGIFCSTYQNLAYINTLKNGEWTDMTPTDVPVNSGERVLYDLTSPVFDPDDPNTMYFGTWFEGVYKMTGNKVVAHYDWNNSPMQFLWSWCDNVMCVQFDKDKNLWVMQMNADPQNFFVSVLPREKQAQTALTADDWIVVDVPIPSDFRAQFIIGGKSNVKVLTTGRYDPDIYIFDDGGNPASKNIKLRKFKSFTDQDNNSFDALYHYCLFEDEDGYIWLGTSDGVVRFNPIDAFDDDFRVERIKLASGRYNDYLLMGQEVSCIAADSYGHKWIGTLNSGIYEVSADGTKILKHFTAGNSYLKSDRILSIACKPDGSAVYIGTEYGFVEYVPDVYPSESDYSKVSISPVNIGAEYTGFVAIEHLVNGSCVTIVDSDDMEVVKIDANGGLAMWNLLNAKGDRVVTGKYFIYASPEKTSRGERVGYVNVIR